MAGEFDVEKDHPPVLMTKTTHIRYIDETYYEQMKVEYLRERARAEAAEVKLAQAEKRAAALREAMGRIGALALGHHDARRIAREALAADHTASDAGSAQEEPK